MPSQYLFQQAPKARRVAARGITEISLAAMCIERLLCGVRQRSGSLHPLRQSVLEMVIPVGNRYAVTGGVSNSLIMRYLNSVSIDWMDAMLAVLFQSSFVSLRDGNLPVAQFDCATAHLWRFPACISVCHVRALFLLLPP